MFTQLTLFPTDNAVKIVMEEYPKSTVYYFPDINGKKWFACSPTVAGSIYRNKRKKEKTKFKTKN